MIPADGEIVEGVASVNEAAITGESAPVIREAGGDRSAVTGGTTVVSDWLKVRITADPGKTFLDRMIALVEGAERQKTPNEMALNVLLAGADHHLPDRLSPPCSRFGRYAGERRSRSPVLVALFICLIPTTIGGLLSAIGIAGMDRLLKFNVLATSGRAVEAAGDVDTLLLDKTGTITHGNRMAATHRRAGRARARAGRRGHDGLAGRRDAGRPLDRRLLAEKGLRGASRRTGRAAQCRSAPDPHLRPRRRTASRSARARWTRSSSTCAAGQQLPAELSAAVDRIARSGGTPLAVAENGRLLGVIHLKDVVKAGVKERFADLRRMGIRTVMITGDNPVTAAAIASEAGVDDFLAEATPEDKLRLIREEQAKGRLVAMCGDGSNDAPALAQADVGVAMQTGTQAAREAGNMVDLDSDPTKVIEIVEVGKQMLITRGALTTFSIANDVAKYFAIIPAIFVARCRRWGRSTSCAWQSAAAPSCRRSSSTR